MVVKVLTDSVAGALVSTGSTSGVMVASGAGGVVSCTVGLGGDGMVGRGATGAEEKVGTRFFGQEAFGL